MLRVMARLQGKISILGLLAVGLMSTACTQERAQPWVWVPAQHAAPFPEPPQHRAAVIDDHDPSVVVFGTPAFIADAKNDHARRDDQMGLHTAEALPNRLGWPEARRPSLNSTRSFRSSTQPERWVYPTERRDYHYHRYTGRRGW
ncbi:MAG: hypothetical protein D6692_13910 [Planctomycetota bacterium]|nr:MAG: hypothetical protein D6692_13910 [Planctomycetota bacterium]